MSEMGLTAAESKATYEEIKEYILKHTGLKVSNESLNKLLCAFKFCFIYEGSRALFTR